MIGMSNKNLIIILSLIALFTVTFVKPEEDVKPTGGETNSKTEVAPEDEASDKELLDQTIKQVLDDMKIQDNSTINRETFRTLFRKILFHDQNEDIPEEEKEIFDKLVERVVMDAPEEFPATDIAKYSELEKITKILNELMTAAGIDTSQLNEDASSEQDGAEDDDTDDDSDSPADGETDDDEEGESAETEAKEQTDEEKAKADL
jgi:hypothetical protein